MAITEVPQYAHLSDADLDAFAAELEAIRYDIEVSRAPRIGHTSRAPSVFSAVSKSRRG